MAALGKQARAVGKTLKSLKLKLQFYFIILFENDKQQ
jgi:hypothetical protein